MNQRSLILFAILGLCWIPVSANAQYAETRMIDDISIRIGGKMYGLAEYELVPYGNFWTRVMWNGRPLLKIDYRLKPLLALSIVSVLVLGALVFSIVKFNRRKAS